MITSAKRDRRGRAIRESLVAGLTLALCLAIEARTAVAQAAPDSLVISVMTMGPGQEIFERFGHISIRVHDLRTGHDSAYNWGMFSFDQPRFLQRFLTGDTRYWMEGYPTLPLVEAYRRRGRWVTEQELALSATQADSLRSYIRWFARDENKYYRYDYFRDNCGTRVRDAIDMVLGGALRRAVIAHEHGVTFRDETLRLGVAYPLLDFGMDFVQGRRSDATMSAWEEMFVPMRVLQLLRDVKVRRADGTMGRLVRAERRLVVDERFAEADAPPDYVLPALAVGLGLAGALLVLSLGAARAGVAHLGIAILGTVWHLAAGTVGVFVLYLGLFTRHVFFAQNNNMLLATPASLALAILFPLAIARPSSRIVRAALALSVLAATCAIVAVALRSVPSLSQQNRPLLALAVPVQLASAFALWRATTGRRAGTP